MQAVRPLACNLVVRIGPGPAVRRPSEPHLSGRTGVAEFGTSNVAAHCRQASVTGVTHDLLVWHAIAVSWVVLRKGT